MSDFTAEEKSARLGLKGMPLPEKATGEFKASGKLSLPTSVDWRSAGNFVNPVKDQGQCGSCWAFASTAVMESRHAIYYGTLYSLSE